MNVNFLGEAILGEAEASGRLKQYLHALQLDEIEVVSVKISTIYSQISPIAREHTIRQICERLELLYRAAAKGRYERADGTEVPKFVYLDMEEYRDLSLTAEVFERTLERVRDIEADWYATFHHIGVLEGREAYLERLERFASVIGKREERLLEYLREPHTLDEVVAHRFVYRPGDAVPFADAVERRSMAQHIERLLEAKRLRALPGDRYATCA